MSTIAKALLIAVVAIVGGCYFLFYLVAGFFSMAGAGASPGGVLVTLLLIAGACIAGITLLVMSGPAKPRTVKAPPAGPMRPQPPAAPAARIPAEPEQGAARKPPDMAQGEG